MTIVRWNPADARRTSMDYAFDRFFGGLPWNGPSFWPEYSGSVAWEPSIDVYETGEELVVRAELPGMEKENIELRIEGGVLTISGRREADGEVAADHYHRLERRYGHFTRAFRLPTLVNEDKTHATYVDGVLTVRLPKAESVRPRRIEIAA